MASIGRSASAPRWSQSLRRGPDSLRSTTPVAFSVSHTEPLSLEALFLHGQVPRPLMGGPNQGHTPLKAAAVGLELRLKAAAAAQREEVRQDVLKAERERIGHGENKLLKAWKPFIQGSNDLAMAKRWATALQLRQQCVNGQVVCSSRSWSSILWETTLI